MREADRRRKGAIPLEPLLSPRLRVFAFRVIGRTFDSRLRDARRQFEKFVIKTERALSRGIGLGHVFSDKRLRAKLEERAAEAVFAALVRPLSVSSNRLGSYEQT